MKTTAKQKRYGVKMKNAIQQSLVHRYSLKGVGYQPASAWQVQYVGISNKLNPNFCVALLKLYNWKRLVSCAQLSHLLVGGYSLKDKQ